jgi:hypothetical protein
VPLSARSLVAPRCDARRSEKSRVRRLSAGRNQQYLACSINRPVEALREGLATSGRLPKLDRPVPLVLTGGSAMPRGFLRRFEQALRPQEFPLELSEIRMSADPLNSTARGALLASLC